MPNIKSAKKRVDVNEKNRAINKAYKSELATGLKKYNAAIASGDLEVAKSLLNATVSLVDESVTRGIIHKNKADRKKADINAKFNALAQTAKPAKVEKKVAKKEEAKVEAPVEATEEVKPVKKTTRKKAETSTEEKPAKKTSTRKTTKKAE
ncbi:MAG: 30S ribosomal protein S20 [Clostridia bacterium]|nr:30S ribosomal protein S20 [Clostridia bacterium]